MSATLAELVSDLGARVLGAERALVDDLAYDSRQVRPGALFAALRGAQTDGHRFVGQALDAGASALLVEEPPASHPASVGVAIVPDTRRALADVAARFFGHPARALALVGVTGTKGKTSTVRIVESVLRAGGRRAGSLGTISVRWPGFEEKSAMTTPESLDLQRWLARMRDAKVEAVAMEVSSHSLALGRVRGLRFAVAVFTQLAHEHLDFHGDLESYGKAKALLFGADLLAGTAVLNAADPWAPRLAEIARAGGNRVVTYARGAAAAADYVTTFEEVELARSRLRVRGPDGELEVVLPLPGDFQIDNALAALAAGRALGLGWDAVRRGLESCPPVPGRLERVGTGAPIVLVDYAHTANSLEKMLSRVRPLVRGRLIAVFGCGGDRDKTKRAPMARAACANADFVIATSDNPRTEDPDAILRDVAAGLSGEFEIESDRRRAIARAVALAKRDDCVVIAGKGHEDYQIVGREKRPFDDREEALAALRARGDAA
ncbi:MAG TPA: UDP-N-acetylmuramoyl-L-alanyl-D-glutamate--2,6-diaminopimelate ligase [Myxococcota bacterium]|nr:UDP-N-acetylmuramoyl-L-alanyl-D-glutamate--2,6-diaminopimelate ligase [Myxococcota bacterium]